MTFDMNTAWSRAMALARENLSLLTVIAGLFLLLPTVAIYLVIPGMEALVDPAASADMTPEQIWAMLGPVFAWSIPIMIVQFIGYNAMVGLMGSARPTVGEALASGAKSLPTIIAAFLIFMIVYMLAAIVAVIPFTVLAAATGITALGVLGPIMIIAVAVFLMTRLSLTMPVIMIETTLNPIAALKRSWDLTGPHQWRVMGFWAMLVIAYIVVSLLITGVLGVVAALAGGGMASKLILGLTNGTMAMIVGIGQCALAVSIYNQLAGSDEAKVASTFD